MNRERITDFLRDPLSVTGDTKGEIRAMAEQHSWCAVLQVLKLLQLQLSSDIQYPSQLKLTAISVPNRFVLKQHVESTERIIREDDTLFRDHVKLKSTEISDQEEETGPAILPAVEVEPAVDTLQEIPPELPVAIPEEPKENIAEAAGEATDIDILPDISPVSKTEIIDQFLVNLPGIIRPKGEFFNPVDVARQSNLDNESIVTETLALIYYRQGLFSKAIKIYEILMLRIPEKSSYFAAQIEKINQDANNQSKA